MQAAELDFVRPAELQATTTAEDRGLRRDEVRLMVTTPEETHHAAFLDLPLHLRRGDLLVVNESETLPASLPARAEPLGSFLVNLSTWYGGRTWLAEPRWGPGRPGPLPLEEGQVIQVGGHDAHLLSEYPGLPRLWFLRVEGDLRKAIRHSGRPIQYGYLSRSYPLEAYQTIFAQVPGSAEMPSAARPFTRRVLQRLGDRGIRVAPIVLHAGVSSLEIEAKRVEEQPLFPEPYEVPASTARLVNETRTRGRQVIAVGTTVVRALETAWDGEAVRPSAGFTRAFIYPQRGLHAVDGLITGFHDPVTTHLAILHTLAGPQVVREAYEEAVRHRYLWHEFGDSHLLLT
ncbi:MAG: S-adenosylmethionine:tRNA ribosyltransferase-isomerase [Thermoplasmata archaeon]